VSSLSDLPSHEIIVHLILGGILRVIQVTGEGTKWRDCWVMLVSGGPRGRDLLVIPNP